MAFLGRNEMCCVTGEALDALLGAWMRFCSMTLYTVHSLSMNIFFCHHLAKRRTGQRTTGVIWQAHATLNIYQEELC